MGLFCILPFPALLKVSEPRLRIAVGGVYSLAFISIAVTIVRAVLIATDAQHSTKKIMILTAVELTVCLVIGIFPGISVAFTRKYVNGHATYPSNRPSNKYKISHSTNTDLSKHQQMAVPDSVELGHLPPRSHKVTKLEDDKESASLFACGSTDQIVPSTRE
ncbi:hypothetical protein B0J13DRAFT_651397 [Dactylonectria estremocensis]|uniref:Integral membrane protein n=1 Tax=Dactylonectria estremocensis TaxID=1079267 RepID=A0A9P9DI60_9HYPO|nr:hypothetical protein B0J13DRAFT_651397 [Dactylonectria estremocensis]